MEKKNNYENETTEFHSGRGENMKNRTNTDYEMTDILYQRLGKDWYAFAEHDGEMYCTRVDEEDMNSSVVAEKLEEIREATTLFRNKIKAA